MTENGESTDKSDPNGSTYLSFSESFSDLYTTASAGSNSPEDFSDMSKLEQFEKNLPETVTFLVSPKGSKVYIVGTGHFSIESQNDVSKVIQIVRPHAVVVELCKSRANIMEMDEETLLNDAKSFSLEKVVEVFKQAGAVQGFVYALLLKLSSGLAKTYGIAPGGEFRRALKEIKQLNNCTVYYGDRPLIITIKRALARLNLWQSICLFCSLAVTKTDDITLEDIEKFKNKDILEELTETLVACYPELSDVLIKERDIYLTNAIQTVASKQFFESNGVLARPRIVAIVGIGHCKGIQEYWGKVDKKDVAPLAIIPKPTRSVRIASAVVKIGVTMLLVYGCCRVLQIKRVQTGLRPLYSIFITKIKFSN